VKVFDQDHVGVNVSELLPDKKGENVSETLGVAPVRLFDTVSVADAGLVTVLVSVSVCVQVDVSERLGVLVL
jgi:prolyl-tRNA editing enzyme YbaK/EbsC (Cys-tRNA(Pro) deacylase)